jgi:uncharacterized metal-binding protein YceD (DUF177 family)
MSDRMRLSDASIRLDSMPAEGRDLVVSVGEEERALLAAQVAVTSLEQLEVKLHADKFRGGMRVHGTLKARLTQPSVVSLEPVTQEILEPLDRVFLPGGAKPFASDAGAEVFVDLEGEDIPDHFDGQEADLSDLIIESLVLAIDPYPRSEGESLESIGINPIEDEDESPFARLKSLKPGGTDA